MLSNSPHKGLDGILRELMDGVQTSIRHLQHVVLAASLKAHQNCPEELSRLTFQL